jgi:hypothetical protein
MVSKSNLDEVSELSKLRKKWSPEEITIADNLIRGRVRARGKLKNDRTIISDLTGIQQATSIKL